MNDYNKLYSDNDKGNESESEVLEATPREEAAPIQVSDNSSDNPSIKVIGCGGCGINNVKKFVAAHPGLPSIIKCAITDTSESNLKGVPDTVERYIINCKGSGKVRSKNVKPIQKEIESSSITKNLADVNILCFSASGGSGSILGPLLAKAIASRGKAVIIFMVLDSISKLDTINSARTIKTLQNTAANEDLYFPIKLFSNMDAINRNSVDVAIGISIGTLIDMLINKFTTELDVNDKLNFLNPHSIDQAAAGCYAFHVSTGVDIKMLQGEVDVDIEDDMPVFSSLSITPGGSAVQVNANVAYTGITSSDTIYHAVNGLELNPEIIDKILLAADKYESMTHATNEKLDKLDKLGGASGSSNLVL